MRMILIGTFLVGLGASRSPVAECPVDSAAVRAARAVTIHPSNDPAFGMEFLLLDFCSRILWGSAGKEIYWQIVVDRERTDRPDSRQARFLLVEPADSPGEDQVLVELPWSYGHWKAPMGIPLDYPRDAPALFEEVFDRLWNGRVALKVVAPGEGDGAKPVSIETVYQSDWDVTFKGKRPPVPLHCFPSTAARRSLSSRADVYAAGDSIGHFYMSFMEFEGPVKIGPTQQMRWTLKLHPDYLDAGVRARVLPRIPMAEETGGLELEPWTPQMRTHARSLYGEGGGFYTGSIPFRELYRHIQEKNADLLLESSTREEIRMPLKVKSSRDWSVSCT